MRICHLIIYHYVDCSDSSLSSIKIEFHNIQCWYELVSSRGLYHGGYHFYNGVGVWDKRDRLGTHGLHHVG